MLSFNLQRMVSSAGRGALIALLGVMSVANADTTSSRSDRAQVWALDVMAPNGQHNLLMGSLHVPDRDLRQPDPSILQSYRVLVTEHSDVDQGVTPAVRWRDALTEDDVATLREQIQCAAPTAPVSVIEGLLKAVLSQPTPLDANQFAYMRCASAGYVAREQLIERARAQYRIRPAYLETPDQAGGAPRALAKEVGAAVSAQSVHFALSVEGAKAQADVVDALNRGDYGAASAALDRSLAGSGINPSVFNEIMVRRRNLSWMMTLPPLLDEGGAFVLVGVGHLPGRDGLIELLRARGYTVTPVTLPAGRGT
ncbi:TraB/GumN family protein [Paraburkholderia youngii]|uniref:TraB/GumN family protein n=1 Tax=Paraburkholderia youngii TaxID=2782701 RepID=UPI003D194B1B